MERLTSSESLYRQTVLGECIQLSVGWVAGQVAGGATYSFAVVDKQDIQQVLEVSRGDKIRVCLCCLFTLALERVLRDLNIFCLCVT